VGSAQCSVICRSPSQTTLPTLAGAASAGMLPLCLQQHPLPANSTTTPGMHMYPTTCSQRGSNMQANILTDCTCHLLLLALLWVLLQMNSPPCRVCGSTDLHYVGMLPGSEEDVSWGAERVEGWDCAQCRVVRAGPGGGWDGTSRKMPVSREYGIRMMKPGAGQGWDGCQEGGARGLLAP
jgi:hypothetical protein